MTERYLGAATIDQFIAGAEANRELWESLRRRAQVPEDVLERAARLPPTHLLVLAEDWCGDAVNTVPVLARLADQIPGWSLWVLERDRNPDLMDTHLTGSSRSIPVVMLLDERFSEVGWWGPRPRELQRWVKGEGQRLDPTERYAETRRWYVRDRGRSTLEEVLAVRESAAAAAA